MKNLILAFDIGTSAVKTTVVSDAMEIVAEASQGYKTSYPFPHAVEQNPEDWWAAAVQSAQMLFAAHPEIPDAIASIGVSGHMVGLLGVDAQGVPTMPSMIHADTRSIAEAALLDEMFGAEALYRITGNVLGSTAPLCKAMWLRRNNESAYRKTARFIQAKDYLNFKLTGNFDTTDYSDASHAMIIDIRKRCYISDVFAEIGLDVEKFPQMHASTEVIGTLTNEAASLLGLRAGIPVAAGGGDGACANLGAGISLPGDTYCSLGTTGWIAACMNEPYIDEKQRVFNIISLDGVNTCVYGTVQSVGRAIEWARASLGGENVQQLNEWAAAAPIGSDKLIFLPYLEGERSPIFDPYAKGVYFGIQPKHTRNHLSRAVFEGVSYALAGIVDILRERNPIDEIRIIGGGSKSTLWKQILADAGRLNIWGVSASSSAATSLGAAGAAGVAAGIFKDLAESTSYIRRTECVTPIADNTAVYLERMKLYRALYPMLKPAFKLSEEG